MRNILIVDGAINATFSVFQATEEEFRAIFPDDRDMEIAEDFVERVGEIHATEILTPIWQRPILKRDANGIHGTLFYDTPQGHRRHLPKSKREVDWDDSAVNEAQRRLFRANR